MPHLHVIQQLDSGFGIQIPTKLLEQIGVHGNDDVEINCQGGYGCDLQGVKPVP